MEELRVETARRLLERTTQSFDEIADRCDFGSSDVLARAFTRVLRLTQYSSATERFEVDSANAARDFLRQHGIDEAAIDVVWDAIALHTTAGIPQHKKPAFFPFSFVIPQQARRQPTLLRTKLNHLYQTASPIN